MAARALARAAALGGAAAVALAGCSLESFSWRSVSMAGHVACLPVATSPGAQQRGLQGVTHVVRPMVFAYSPPSKPSFWMKDTPSPLTGVWVGADGRVIGFWHGQPESEASHDPPAPVSAVVEYPAAAPVPPLGASIVVLGSCRPPDRRL